MRLEIAYNTRYEYEPAVHRGLTALRLRPASRPGLLVESAELSAPGGRLVAAYLDGWGTCVDLVEFPAAHTSAEFEVRAIVETQPAEWDRPPAPDEQYFYTGDSSRVRSAAVEPFGWAVADEGRSWQAVESALAWMPQRFFYRIGTTDAETPIEDAIAVGSGVCQDFAHIFLALLRRWGWCARYVSGYFFNAEAEAPRILAEAMHAWVEVYRPGVGWIGLDATSGRYSDERYVPVGFGRDYDDVRPVRGVLLGESEQAQEQRFHDLRPW